MSAEGLRILLTNDDGIHAEGFEVLRSIAAKLSRDIWVAAPETEQSGASRGITLADPLRVRRVAEKEWAVTGTPTDAVLLAVNDLMPAPPDLILSGVNRGQNICEDVTFSGTVAGALQGMALGVPSIALSQAIRIRSESPQLHWGAAAQLGPGLIARAVAIGWPKNVVLNINFPDAPAEDVTEVELTSQGSRDLVHMHADRRTDLRGREYYWMGFKSQASVGAAGTDIAALQAGRVSVTPLHVDMTHRQTLHALHGQLGGSIPSLKIDGG